MHGWQFKLLAQYYAFETLPGGEFLEELVTRQEGGERSDRKRKAVHENLIIIIASSKPPPHADELLGMRGARPGLTSRPNAPATLRETRKLEFRAQIAQGCALLCRLQKQRRKAVRVREHLGFFFWCDRGVSS
ncbi:hypothetical protein CDAR_96611 [Caerostris darwini]|uniref:Uncharacterized protein n=1 Tax=Caerostris darwini TaxID=1538125 RepID=A0AAV4QU93_9ARAC|nr:hypothetical protein CDAR_96611 [Caerostris darwini]